MGVDTKGVVQVPDTSVKTYSNIMSTIQKATRRYVLDVFEEKYEGMDNQIRRLQTFHGDPTKTGYRIPQFAGDMVGGGMISGRLCFSFEHEHRMMFFCAYTTDHGAFEGPGLCLSLGYWGESVEIMTYILKTVRDEWNVKVWFDKNDCDDVGYEEMTE